jgi:hypothetical protein
VPNERHAVHSLACKAHAQARTNPAFAPAAALFEAAPRRTRPPSWRAEKDKVCPTTSKSANSTSVRRGPDVACRQTSPPRIRPTLSRPGAWLRRRRKATPISAAQERRGQLLPADLRHRWTLEGFFLVFGRKSICEVLFLPAGLFDRATELYHNVLSGCSGKIRVALAEKGLNYKSNHIHLIETGWCAGLHQTALSRV